ncbi:MAG: CRTAC1 family protein, partial [Actinobacteria bacterium]|nr:CRTAC1 family protein [Actinomycetota bacterium]NIT95298.1 CRTAC1 family protein [Actinomycetota bacterium]NIU18967.1 CRTAC1 family protein [Actinomycetota bacterium]NIV55467.1 CRTAC1 family protein [Actinomycetota bacterium]NIV86841.1 CRTAC1 family protein [Actinomycetota bacterium]
PPPPTAAEAWFREAASAAGLDFRHVSGHAGPFWLPEVIGGGVCLLDADGDGDLDVYLVQSGSLHEPETGETPSRLFLNDGTGHFADRTAEAGVGATGYGIGCTTGDYDA